MYAHLHMHQDNAGIVEDLVLKARGMITNVDDVDEGMAGGDALKVWTWIWWRHAQKDRWM